MNMKVYLPGDIYSGINRLTRQDNEVSGFLLYRKLGRWEDNHSDAFIAACYITGEGSPLSVSADSSRVSTLNKFLARNPNYNAIDFHTHTEETIRKCGEYFRNNFSRRDIEEYNKSIKRHPAYSAVLFTPGTSGELLYTSYPEDYDVIRRDWKEDDGRVWREVNHAIMNEISLLQERRGVPPVPIVEFF